MHSGGKAMITFPRILRIAFCHENETNLVAIAVGLSRLADERLEVGRDGGGDVGVERLVGRPVRQRDDADLLYDRLLRLHHGAPLHEDDGRHPNGSSG